MRGPVIDSEWVPTGADFARNHKGAQRLGAIWLVLVWVALHGLLLAWCLTVLFASGGQALLALPLIILLILNDAVTLLTLIGRHPLASRGVWICLVVSFPLSLPLMVYWADGIRPNLICRHRFARLVRTDPEGIRP